MTVLENSLTICVSYNKVDPAISLQKFVSVISNLSGSFNLFFYFNVTCIHNQTMSSQNEVLKPKITKN